jgi:hypothetical protein
MKIAVGQERNGKYISRNAFGPCYSGLVAHCMKQSTESPPNLQLAFRMLSPKQHYFPRGDF